MGTSEKTPEKNTNKHSNATIVTLVGLALFAMFFGAGNLIFPPQLGSEAGYNYAPAITGFLITGVALPVLGVIAVSLSGTGISGMALRVGKIFAVVFPVMVYLSIGCFYAIPRTANVAFEMGISAVIGKSDALMLFLFTAVFFAISLWLSLQKTGIVNAIGRWLTPALLILIIALVVVGSVLLAGSGDINTEPFKDYANAPLAGGIVKGYLTMDSLAAIVFGIVVLRSLRAGGVRPGKATVYSSIGSGLIAGILLAVVYLGLGHLGHKIGGHYENGALLLAQAAELSFGAAGSWIFAAIVFLACLTTAIGLITSTSQYFSSLLPFLSYRGWCVAFSAVGLLMSNLGLSSILAMAGPLNVFLYPMAIALIVLTLLQAALPFRLVWTYRLPVAVAGLMAIADFFHALDFDLAVGPFAFITHLPLYEHYLAWIMPVGIVVVLCTALDWKIGKPAPILGAEAHEIKDEEEPQKEEVLEQATS